MSVLYPFGHIVTYLPKFNEVIKYFDHEHTPFKGNL